MVFSNMDMFFVDIDNKLNLNFILFLMFLFYCLIVLLLILSLKCEICRGFWVLIFIRIYIMCFIVVKYCIVWKFEIIDKDEYLVYNYDGVWCVKY